MAPTCTWVATQFTSQPFQKTRSLILQGWAMLFAAASLRGIHTALIGSYAARSAHSRRYTALNKKARRHLLIQARNLWKDSGNISMMVKSWTYYLSKKLFK